MKLKNLLQTKSIAFNIALIIYFFTAIGVMAQSLMPPIFDAPWRGFDTGIIGNGFAPVSFAVGDLDGDADADALVGNSFLSPGIAVLKNRGDGTFDLPVSSALPFGETIGEVALSDFDRDGDLDAFATIRGSNDELAKIAVWRNAGDGSFTVARVEFPTGQAPVGIWVADFTGDTFPDVVTANYGYLGSGNTVSLLRHNGQTGSAAAFLAPVNYAAGAAPLRLAAADVNGDNRLDLAVGHIRADNPATPVPISILLNGGSGNFAAPFDYESAPGARLFTAAVTFGDLDNDGDADLIGGGLYPNGSVDNGAIIVRRNNGAGAFGNHEIYLFPNNVDRPQKLTVADITGDGFADILAASPTGRTTDGWSLLKSNGTGGFLPAVRYEASQQTLDVKAADVDGDGDLDVATAAQSSAAVTIHENPGNGVFRVPTRYNVAALPDAVESADIDNDGDIDIVVNSEVSIASSSAVVKILKNNGDGTFAPAIDYTSSRNFGDMKLRDINGDGFVDLIFAPDRNYPPYNLGIALNNGNGTFAPTVVRLISACGRGTIDAFDLDGDGDLDIVFTEEQTCQGVGARIFILRNDGNQNFFQMPSLNPPGLPHGLAIADITGDGKADIITAVSGSMEVFPGNGNLTFNAPILSTSEPYKFTTADFNNDGKLDLGMIMPQNSFGTDLIGTALGNGNGTFQAVRTQTGSSVLETLRISCDLDAADFNGDGKPDLLTYNCASNDVSLFLSADDGSLLPQQRYGIGNTPFLGTAADFNRDGKIDIAASIALPPSGLQSAVVVLRNMRAQIPTPTPTPFVGMEADVAVRPNGDGSILSDDVVQIRRFLNATHTPDPMTNEFQRADSSPFAEKGDGVLNSADVVQTRRYQNGTSPLQMAGGPTLPSGGQQSLTDEFNKTEAQSKLSEGNPSEVRVESTSGSAGQTVTVNILVDAAGDESEYAFILDYDESVLSNPVIGAGSAGASVRSCNASVAGQINCSVGGFADNNPNSADSGIGEIGAETNQVLMTVTFTVAANAAGDTPLTLSNVNASSDAPQLFTPTATNGTVTRFSVRQRYQMR